MPKFTIGVIPGDGVGKEVIAEGIKALKHLESLYPEMQLDFTTFPWGSDYYFSHGVMMPDDALETLQAFDAIYLGAVGDPRLPDHVTLQGLLLPIRRRFDQYVNLRPAILYPGAPCPLKNKNPGDIDMVVIRENTEGEYSDIGGRVYQGTEHEVVTQGAIFTRRGTERIIRYAFEIARQRAKKKKVSSITKSNAQRYGMVFWDEVFRQVAADYPDIETESYLIDAACMHFVRKPESFDVVVASNLFGDILTDLSAILVGGMGLAPSANLNPTRKFPSMFEPVHGSAPDIAGQGLANPLAALMAAQMMLDFLGQTGPAHLLDKAIRQVLADGKTLTPDLGGKAKTSEVGDEVVHLLSRFHGER